MGSSYVGEIRMFAGNFAIQGWAFCDGSLLPISQYDTLFNLIGTTYGGDGQNTFALPDLRSRVPVHMGTGSTGTTFQIGQSGGVEELTLNVTQLPVHNHSFVATGDAGSLSTPGGSTLARFAGHSAYIQAAPTAALGSQSLLASSGGGQPHDNLQPFLCVNFIISLFGVFPSPT